MPTFQLRPFCRRVPSPLSRAFSVCMVGGEAVSTGLLRGLKGTVEGRGPVSARAPRQVVLLGSGVRGGPSWGPQVPLLVTGVSEVWQMWTTERWGRGKLSRRDKGQGSFSLAGLLVVVSPGRGLWDLSRAHVHPTCHPPRSCPPRAGSNGPVAGGARGAGGWREMGERCPPKALKLDGSVPSSQLGWNPLGWCSQPGVGRCEDPSGAP